MRLLHVSSSYPLSGADGTAPFMEEMLSALAERGHEVTAIVPHVHGLETGHRAGVSVVGVRYAPSPLQVWGHGQSLDQLGRVRTSAAAVTPLAMSAMALRVRKMFRETAPDVVHLHWLLPLGALGLVLPQDAAIVVSVHGADARFATGLLRPVTRMVLARTDALVAASRPILDEMASIAPDVRSKMSVIRHGARDLADMTRAEARKGLGIDASLSIVLAVGRLVRKKGFGSLIKSFEHIYDPKVHLFVVGEGPDRSVLMSEIPDGTHGRIHLVGQKDRREVGRWLAAADLVAVPSEKISKDVDSGPVVLMEAMAAGRPVVASRIGMAPQLIEHGVNGYLLDSLDPLRIASTISEALEAAETLGKAARQTYEQIGGWDRVASELEHLYESITKAV